MKALDFLEDFFFRYFSRSTADTKDGWVRYVVFGIQMIPFTLGFFFTVVGFYDLARFFGWVMFWMLIPFGLLWVITWVYHYCKLKNLGKKWK